MSATVILGGQVDSIGRGAHDDSREGAILTKIAQGDLVRVPFPNTIATAVVGTSTASHGSSASNPDGSQHGYTLTCPAGLTQGAILRCTAYGRIIGVRFQRSSSTTPPFTVKVNGVIYAVRNTRGRRNAQAASISDNEALFIVAEDLLSDGPHTIEISLASEAGTSRSVVMYGLLLEASKGYAVYPQVASYAASPQAVTASAVAITASGFAVRKLSFFNTTGADRTVTLKNGANSVRVITVPTAAPSYAEHDFGQPVDVTGWTVQADTTGVNLFTQQGVRIR